MIRKQQNTPPAAAEDRGSLHAKIAIQIHQARTQAGLSQKELAERVGTRQAQIARLEDSGFRGHSLDMLQRIADGLGKLLAVQFCDVESIDFGAAAAQRLKAATPPNSVLLKLAERAQIPPEIEDVQEERPW